MRKKFILLLLASAIAVAAVLRDEPASDGASEYRRVIRVVDGDTFIVDNGTEKGERVRLIGVDAPETRRSRNKEIGYYGLEAKAYLTAMLTGKQVKLELDAGPRDRYGRTLAYAYLEDGKFVNAELIRNGYAMVMTIPPNVKYADTFAELQAYARENQLGLWKASNAE